MIQKTLIANWGYAGQGKSATIRNVANNLISNHGATITQLVTPIMPTNGDIKAVLSYNNLIIGIESQGDPNSRLFGSIPDFLHVKCDIILCATRTSGATVDIVKNAANSNHYRLFWTTNNRTPNNQFRTSLNTYSANQITQLILDVSNGII